MSALGPYTPEPSPASEAAQACIEMQIAREVAGFKVGEHVRFQWGGTLRDATIRAFSCDDDAPAALLLLDGPREWVFVRKLDALQALDKPATLPAERLDEIRARARAQ